MILGQRALTFPDWTQGGIRVSEPPKEGAAPVWYDPVGAFDAAGFLGDIYAWRAIDTPGSPWGAGPANYAATLTDENNGQVLVEGNGAVAWAGATGWQFTAALSQYFDTGLVAATNWSVFVQFSGAGTLDAYVFGSWDVTNTRLFAFLPRIIAADRHSYWNTTVSQVAPRLVAGNAGISDNDGFLNGIDECNIVTGLLPAVSLFIGALHRDIAPIASNFYNGNIQAAWLCTSNPAIVQANALTLATAMGQL